VLTIYNFSVIVLLYFGCVMHALTDWRT
jgi:hypothetical protein